MTSPKTLCLLRHCKSAWPSGAPDFDRPLNGRGRDAAGRIGRYLAQQKLAPDVVLCSAATRTRETLDLASLFWTSQPTIIIEPDLYLASERTLLAHIRRIDARHKVALVIGHNPAMQGLALELAAGARPAELDRLATKYPTGGLAMFDLKGEWSTAAPGAFSFRAFETPRTLERI